LALSEIIVPDEDTVRDGISFFLIPRKHYIDTK
jgi:hypothetical protein